MPDLPRVTVWNEYRHEREDEPVMAIYPDGMHAPIAKYLTDRGFPVRVATMDEPEHGLTDEVLAETDVLTWWGHRAHQQVSDEIVDRVYQRVLDGMGLIPLHSSHFSKIFKKLMGTSCGLYWRNIGEKERVWVVNPGHPIADGLGEYFEIPHAEAYGEPFDIPEPDALVFGQLVRRRRGLPQRLLLQEGPGQGLLLPSGRPGLPYLPPRGDPSRHQERGPLGRPRRRRGRPAQPNDHQGDKPARAPRGPLLRRRQGEPSHHL